MTHEHPNPVRILPEQELLLKAALFSGQEAQNAWETWRLLTDLNGADTNSIRLLPLVYRNLTSHGLNDPALNTLKRHYQATWYQNQMAVKKAAGIAASLAAKGIPILFLKGIPLLVLYYQDFGVRPMYDIDLLVPTHLGIEAARIILSLGWMPKNYNWTEAFHDPEYFGIMHSQNFFSNGYEVDLHWHLGSNKWLSDHDNQEYWAAASPMRMQNITAQTLNPTDLLMHVCLHGVSWSKIPMIRWVADAAIIIRKKGASIDWERLSSQASTQGLTLPLLGALLYLKSSLELSIPETVIRSLQQNPVSKIERSNYRVLTQESGPLTDFKRLWQWHYRREMRLQRYSFGQIVFRFPRFLGYRWGLRQPGYLLLDSLKKIRRHFVK